jgi:hypothetical protein
MPTLGDCKPARVALFRRISDGRLFHFPLYLDSGEKKFYFESDDGIRAVTENPTITIAGVASPCTHEGSPTIEELNAALAAAPPPEPEKEIPLALWRSSLSEQNAVKLALTEAEASRPGSFLEGLAQANRQAAAKFQRKNKS